MKDFSLALAPSRENTLLCGGLEEVSLSFSHMHTHSPSLFSLSCLAARTWSSPTDSGKQPACVQMKRCVPAL